jgi:predicted RNase H-like HicB family nuclease
MNRLRKFTVVIERDEDGYYVASVPALRACHTRAKNLDTLMKRVREVISLCLESDGRVTTVPVHSGETVGPDFLRSIFRDVSAAELMEHL